MDEETKRKIGEAQRKAWASGKRKPIPQEAKDRAIESIRNGWKNGRKPTILTTDQYKKNLSMRDPEEHAETNRKNGILRRGTPNPIGKTGKCEGNVHAKKWELKSPDNKIYRFINLNEFIRNNTDLFPAKDVEWYGPTKSACLAAKGLRKLFYMKKNGERRYLSWKGWTIGDKFEIETTKELKNGR